MMHDNGCFVKSLRAELTALCYTQTAYSGRLPLRLVAEVGMGERFTAASRPESGHWVAMARALELCRTQPSVCSHTPSSPGSPVARGPQGESYDLPFTTLCPRTTARLTELSRTFNLH